MDFQLKYYNWKGCRNQHFHEPHPLSSLHHSVYCHKVQGTWSRDHSTIDGTPLNSYSDHKQIRL